MVGKKQIRQIILILSKLLSTNTNSYENLGMIIFTSGLWVILIIVDIIGLFYTWSDL